MTPIASRKTPIFAIALITCMLAAPTLLSAQPWQEGVHFERISGPESTGNGEVEVVEVFSYMCPACRMFQPFVAGWEEQLPEQVAFRRVPVAWRNWEPMARAYYTAEVLDIVEESHEALFVALHDRNQQFGDMRDLGRFYSQFGVEAERFESTARSFPVESKVRMGNAAVGKWQVRSTPTLVVNGKYRISPRRDGGTYEEMLRVADYLIEQELAEAGQTSAAVE